MRNQNIAKVLKEYRKSGIGKKLLNKHFKRAGIV